MKRLRATFILSGFLIIYGAMAFSQGEGEAADISALTGTIRGSILDTTPAQNFIEGVKVVVVGIDGTEHETWTDSRREYEIFGVSPGRYLISIYKDGYHERVDKPVTVVTGGEHYVPMKMTPAQTPIKNVEVVIVDPDGTEARGEGTPTGTSASTGVIRGIVSDTTPAQNFIEGVKVVVVGIDGTEHETWTDSRGEYEISGVSPVRYLISIYKDGYRERVGKPVTVVAGGDHYVPMKMAQKDNLASFLRKFGLFPGVFLLCLIALAVVAIVKLISTLMRGQHLSQ